MTDPTIPELVARLRGKLHRMGPFGEAQFSCSDIAALLDALERQPSVDSGELERYRERYVMPERDPQFRREVAGEFAPSPDGGKVGKLQDDALKRDIRECAERLGRVGLFSSRILAKRVLAALDSLETESLTTWRPIPPSDERRG